MRYRVVVSESADDDVDRLRDFMLEAAPQAWPAAAEAIAAAIESLIEFPERGWPMLRANRRELLVPFGRSGYVIQYRIYERTVFVARIFHGREDRPLA